MNLASSVFPICFQDVLDAQRALRPHLPPTPLRNYAALDRAVGRGIKVFVKHENHNPTNSFKARNALSALTALAREERRRGVVAASRGNHGQGLAWAGGILGVPVTVCVPLGNNPEKNEAMRGFGAEVVEEGSDYDEAIRAAERLSRERGLRVVHSTNEPKVIAGAATMALEILEERPGLDALVVPVGGGSQAVGALAVARRLRPGLKVYAAQAENASAAHDSWHAGRPLTKAPADTLADGLATRTVYELAFGAMREGLAGFVTVSEAQLAEAIRLYHRATHNLAEGAGAAALAGLMKLGGRLAGMDVAVVLSGSNIDARALARVFCRGTQPRPVRRRTLFCC